MKKARIILAAIAVFAVVGGSLAFKARGVKTYFITNTLGANATKSVPQAAIGDGLAYYWTTISNTPANSFNNIEPNA